MTRDRDSEEEHRRRRRRTCPELSPAGGHILVLAWLHALVLRVTGACAEGRRGSSQCPGTPPLLGSGKQALLQDRMCDLYGCPAPALTKAPPCFITVITLNFRIAIRPVFILHTVLQLGHQSWSCLHHPLPPAKASRNFLLVAGPPDVILVTTALHFRASLSLAMRPALGTELPQGRMSCERFSLAGGRCAPCDGGLAIPIEKFC